jgi:hypothetical protein
MRRYDASDTPQPPPHKDECGFSSEFKQVVHRFDLAARTCRCGRLTINAPTHAKARYRGKKKSEETYQ